MKSPKWSLQKAAQTKKRSTRRSCALRSCTLTCEVANFAMASSIDDDNVTNSLGLRSERGELLVPSRMTYSETLKIAALYAGRWFGPSAFAHVAREHLQHIIRPNSMDVFLTVDPTSWCVAPKQARTAYLDGDFATAEHELTRQARVLFEFWPRLHVAFVSAEDPTMPHSYGGRAKDALRAAVGGRINPSTGKWTFD